MVLPNSRVSTRRLMEHRSKGSIRKQASILLPMARHRKDSIHRRVNILRLTAASHIRLSSILSSLILLKKVEMLSSFRVVRFCGCGSIKE